MQVNAIKLAFQAMFTTAPRIFRAPGRVNLIGEHTDYNDGFVMPAAVDLYTWVAIAPRKDRIIQVHSLNFQETFSFVIDGSNHGPTGHWSDYVRGVAHVLEQTLCEQSGTQLSGTNILIHGEVPIGSGLSSSAALEIAVGYALLSISGITIDRKRLAVDCQTAEHLFAGTRCGIMDQFISCHGRTGNALLLDCRSLSYDLLPLRQDVNVIVCNTMVKHALATGEYNSRRAECESGVRHYQNALPQKQVRALRDITSVELNSHNAGLTDEVYRRCRHVVTENERVQRAATMLRSDDMAGFAKLMAESHASLRDDYHVSCLELDTMVEIAARQAGMIGARMTGGGFGGCTVNLVESSHADRFKESVAHDYESIIGTKPDIYICSTAEGVLEVEI